MKKIKAKKAKDYDQSYEVYGQFITKKMKYSLSVTEGFADLHNARHCAAMLKRGGCEKVSIHLVKVAHVKKTYKRIPL